MNRDEMIEKIRDHWNEISDSEWYRSLRAEECIRHLQEDPASAFHPDVFDLIHKFIPDLAGRHILLPSSGDNHAAFAFAMLGAHVTSSDISERQLERAADIAGNLGLQIEFVCDDTMELAHIPDRAYDLVYTSNGTLTWIDRIDRMYQNIGRVLKKGGYSVMYDMHPFNRPFSGEPWKVPCIVKSYQDVFPDLHWRVQDLVNSQIRAGLRICELAELSAQDASFWYTFAELQGKNKDELEGLNDWTKNPMAALPAWIAMVSKKD